MLFTNLYSADFKKLVASEMKSEIRELLKTERSAEQVGTRAEEGAAQPERSALRAGSTGVDPSPRPEKRAQPRLLPAAGALPWCVVPISRSEHRRDAAAQRGRRAGSVGGAISVVRWRLLLCDTAVWQCGRGARPWCLCADLDRFVEQVG